MVLRVEDSVWINAPVERVFAFVSDVEKRPLWAKAVVEAEKLTPGPIAAGTLYRQKQQFLGTWLELEIMVSAYIPDQQFSTVTTRGPVSYEVHALFEAADGGTRLTQSVEGERITVFRMTGPFFLNQIRHYIKANHERLKQMMEAAPDGLASGKC